MEPATHPSIDRGLCGTPEALAPGRAEVALETRADMAVDPEGLVHGGFVFGLADHAAMLAVNDPFVVLGAADVRFERPVRVGERLVATARVSDPPGPGRKRLVEAEVRRGDDVVLRGRFTCLVLDRHVLAASAGPAPEARPQAAR